MEVSTANLCFFFTSDLAVMEDLVNFELLKVIGMCLQIIQIYRFIWNVLRLSMRHVLASSLLQVTTKYFCNVRSSKI
ncbi:hypothetical protein VNO77_23953 [Canavalia gladiata]|uniref:Uncharacterized protein n=1 Tax=Canavalia gladiata TaxID=3824 RepID=A0AAN9L5U8_CANGL